MNSWVDLRKLACIIRQLLCFKPIVLEAPGPLWRNW